MMQSRIAIPLGALALGVVAGLTLGWKLYRPKPSPKQTAAPAIQQADGSTVLERKPDAKPEPHHELPKGSKLERQVSLEVLPFTPTGGPEIPGSGSLKPSNPGQSASNPGLIAVNSVNPRPIHIDLSLVKMQDGTQRVVASSTNGTIVGGMDIPVEPVKPEPKPLKWAAGVLWNPSESTYGAFITRGVGPFVVGAQVYQQRLPLQIGGGTKVEGMIAVGIRW